MSQLLNKLTNLVVSKITDENLIQNDDKNYMEIEENTFYRDIDYNFKLCLHFHNASDDVDPLDNYLLYINTNNQDYIRKLSNDFNFYFYCMQSNESNNSMLNESFDFIIYSNDSYNKSIFSLSCLIYDDNNKMIFDLGDAEDYCTSISNNLDLPWSNDYTGYVLNEDVNEFHIDFYFDTQNPKGN